MTCGAVWGCGFGAHRHLGVGDMADRHAPVRMGRVEAFGQSKVHMVKCGGNLTVAVTEEGALWS
jgi:alpha-tubulin suppressor-like RCC1 family protein